MKGDNVFSCLKLPHFTLILEQLFALGKPTRVDNHAAFPTTYTLTEGNVIQAGQSKYSIPLVRSLEWPYSSDDQNPFSETDQFSSVQSLSCVRLFVTP